MLAGGRNNFSSGSEEPLIQQMSPHAVLAARTTPDRAPCLLPLCSCHPKCCLGSRELRFLLSSARFYLCPRHVSPAEASPSLRSPFLPRSPLLPDRAWSSAAHTHGTLLKCSPWHGHNLSESSLQQLRFSHSHLKTARLASSSSTLGMGRKG